MAIGSSRSDFQVAAVRKRLFGNSHSKIECAGAARGGRAALLAAGVLVMWGAESKRSDRGHSAEAAGCRFYLDGTQSVPATVCCEGGSSWARKSDVGGWAVTRFWSIVPN